MDPFASKIFFQFSAVAVGAGLIVFVLKALASGKTKNADKDRPGYKKGVCTGCIFGTEKMIKFRQDKKYGREGWYCDKCWDKFSRTKPPKERCGCGRYEVLEYHTGGTGLGHGKRCKQCWANAWKVHEITNSANSKRYKR